MLRNIKNQIEIVSEKPPNVSNEYHIFCEFYEHGIGFDLKNKNEERKQIRQT